MAQNDVTAADYLATALTTPTGLAVDNLADLFAERVATVTNHAALAAIVPTSGAPTFYCSGHTTAGDGGEGLWRWVAGNSDTADDCITLGSNAAGRWKRVFSGPVNVKWAGAKGDSIYVADAAITSSDATLTAASAPFVSGDAGKVIVVLGAGSNGDHLITTIDSYTSAGEVELTDTASTTVSGTEAIVNRTNDYSAIQAAIDTGYRVYIPKGVYYTGTALNAASNGLLDIFGDGGTESILCGTGASSTFLVRLANNNEKFRLYRLGFTCADYGYYYINADTDVTDELIINDCEFFGIVHAAVYARGVVNKFVADNSKFRDIRAASSQAVAIRVSGNIGNVDSSNYRVVNCDFNNIVCHSASAEVHAIILYGFDALIFGNRIKDVYCTNTSGTGDESIYTKVARALIDGNIIRNGGAGAGSITAKGADYLNPPATGSGNPWGAFTRIINNTIIGNSSYPPEAEIALHSDFPFVANNLIEDSYANYGIKITNSNGAQIIDNIVDKFHGLYCIGGSCNGSVDVRGNRIIGALGVSGSDLCGIRLGASNDSTFPTIFRVIDNYIHFDDSPDSDGRLYGYLALLYSDDIINGIFINNNDFDIAKNSPADSRAINIYTDAGSTDDIEVLDVRGNYSAGSPSYHYLLADGGATATKVVVVDNSWQA